VKLLLDQGLPRGAVAILQQLGVDTVHTGQIGMATATDEAIVSWARQDGRVIVTLDADFHTLLVLSGAISPSVIRIRVEGLRAERLAELVHQVMTVCAADLQQPTLITVDSRRIRVRTLPLDR